MRWSLRKRLRRKIVIFQRMKKSAEVRELVEGRNKAAYEYIELLKTEREKVLGNTDLCKL